MDSMKEGDSTSRPPLLNGMNYGYWKARICAFIKSIHGNQFYKDGSCIPKPMMKGKLFPRTKQTRHLKKTPFPPKTHGH